VAALPLIVKRLRQLLHTGYSEGRLSAAVALWRLGANHLTEQAVEQLMELLCAKDDGLGLRSRSAAALAQMATDAQPNLLVRWLELSRHGRSDVRAGAIDTLGQMRIVEALPDVLMQFAVLLDEDRNSGILCNTVEALGHLGGSATPPAVVRKLMALLDDEEYLVRLRAAEALGQIGAKARQAEIFGRLIEFLHNENRRITEERRRREELHNQMSTFWMGRERVAQTESFSESFLYWNARREVLRCVERAALRILRIERDSPRIARVEQLAYPT
jgi:HEAT repeat protein